MTGAGPAPAVVVPPAAPARGTHPGHPALAPPPDGPLPAAAGRVVLAVNPTAGRGRSGRSAVQAQTVLAAAGLSPLLVQGRDAPDALRLLRAAVAAGARAVVAVGGDGMVHLAVQAVAGTGVPLGIVAAGTGNDIAAALGLPVGDARAAATVAVAALAAERTRAVDLARTDVGAAATAGPEVAVPATRPRQQAAGAGAGDPVLGPVWFAGVLGAGFDSAVNERANRMRWPTGPRRYDIAIVGELRAFRPAPFTLTLDGHEQSFPAMLVAVGNTGVYGGGMRVAPDADPADGELDVTVVGPLTRAQLLRVFPRVYRGTHVRHPAVRTFRARQVQIASPGVVAYADGERLGPLPLRAQCIPGALRVLSP